MKKRRKEEGGQGAREAEEVEERFWIGGWEAGCRRCFLRFGFRAWNLVVRAEDGGIPTI
jgi:hypothetical protein